MLQALQLEEMSIKKNMPGLGERVGKPTPEMLLLLVLFEGYLLSRFLHLKKSPVNFEQEGMLSRQFLRWDHRESAVVAEAGASRAPVLGGRS